MPSDTAILARDNGRTAFVLKWVASGIQIAAEKRPVPGRFRVLAVLSHARRAPTVRTAVEAFGS